MKSYDIPTCWKPRKYEFPTSNPPKVIVEPKKEENNKFTLDNSHNSEIINQEMHQEYVKLIEHLHESKDYYLSLDENHPRMVALNEKQTEFRRKMLEIAKKYAPENPDAEIP